MTPNMLADVMSKQSKASNDWLNGLTLCAMFEAASVLAAIGAMRLADQSDERLQGPIQSCTFIIAKYHELQQATKKAQAALTEASDLFVSGRALAAIQMAQQAQDFACDVQKMAPGRCHECVLAEAIENQAASLIAESYTTIRHWA